MFHLNLTYGYGCQSKEVVTIGFLVFIHFLLSLCKNILLILLRGTELWISRFFLNIKSVLKIFGKSTKLKRIRFLKKIFFFFWSVIFSGLLRGFYDKWCVDVFWEFFKVRKNVVFCVSVSVIFFFFIFP